MGLEKTEDEPQARKDNCSTQKSRQAEKSCGCWDQQGKDEVTKPDKVAVGARKKTHFIYPSIPTLPKILYNVKQKID